MEGRVVEEEEELAIKRSGLEVGWKCGKWKLAEGHGRRKAVRREICPKSCPSVMCPIWRVPVAGLVLV